MKYPMLIFAIIAAAALLGPASGGKDNGDTTKGKLKEAPIQIKETVADAEAVAIPKNTNKVKSMLFKVTQMPNYYESFKQDENFCSVFLERIDRRKEVIEVTEIPAIVKKKNATWVKVILPALDVVPSPDEEPTKDLRTLLKSTRISELGEKNIGWNAGDQSTLELDEMLKQYEEEVDQKLQQLGIPLSTMKRVSLTFPFSP